jgi:hypothetical protein
MSPGSSFWLRSHSSITQVSKGVFGVDFVLRQGEAWFIEVNPRLTASHMLYENAASRHREERSLVTRHLAAFGWRPADNTSPRRQRLRNADASEVPCSGPLDPLGESGRPVHGLPLSVIACSVDFRRYPATRVRDSCRLATLLRSRVCKFTRRVAESHPRYPRAVTR